MKRREFIAVLSAVGTWPVLAYAQSDKGLRRIGVLIALAQDSAEGQLRLEAFRQGLKQSGWSEGENIGLDVRWTGGSRQQLDRDAAELISAAPDALLAGNTTALIALQKATDSIPIIFTQVGDPLFRGYVTSLARPAGNATGFALYDHTVASKWLQLLLDVVPSARRIAVIFDPINGGDTYASEIENASPPGIHIQPFSIRSRADVEQALDRIGNDPDTALLVLSGPLTAQHRDLIIAMAIKYRLPILHPYRYYAANGALMSYGPDVVDQYRRAAEYVDRILRGAKVTDLPIQFATSYKLVINLKTAKVLDLVVPATLLARADEVIE